MASREGEHHHHSTISGYAFLHSHDPRDHDSEQRHDDGQTPDDPYFGPAHYEHAPFTLRFNDPPWRRRTRHPRYRWARRIGL